MADNTTAVLPPVPLRTPMHDAAGNLARTWVIFFQSLGGLSSDQITELISAALADDGNVTYKSIPITY